jgi:5,10-methylenetetrahydromethanopterin reductase
MAREFEVGVLLQAVDPPNEYAALIRRIEELGFDAVWVADSSLHARYVWSYLTIAALNSTRLKLSTGITHPFTRHPAVNMNAWATLDEVSGGRAILGIGAGDRPVLELGMKPAPIDAVRQMVELCRALAMGDTVTYEGKWFSTRDARLQFPGRKAVPIYIAASGPKALRLAGEIADGALVQVGTAPACINYARDQIAQGAGTRGLADFDLSAMVYGSVKYDRDEARNDARPFAAWIPQTVPLYCKLVGIPPEDVRAVQANYRAGELMKAHDAARATTDAMIDHFTLAGTPAECRQKINDLLSAGATSVTFFPMGEDRPGTLERFAREVVEPIRG